MPLATLSIDLVAKLAGLQQSLDQGVGVVEQAAKKMEGAFDSVKSAALGIVSGLVAGLSVVAFERLISGAVESAAKLKELSERSQSTVEGLSAIGAIAKLSGVDIESVATALQKLAKNQVDAIDGGKKTGEAFRSIGIATKDLIGLKPDEVYTLLAQKLGQFADGSEKAAVAQALLGKAGAGQLGVLADLGIAGAYQVRVTEEQAAQALDYEKNLIRLQAVQKSVFKTIALELVPVLDALSKAFLGAATEAGGVRGAVKDLAADGTLRSWAETAARVVGFVGDAFQGVSRLVQATGLYLGATAASVGTVLDSSLKTVGPKLAALRAQVKGDLAAIADAPLFSDRVAAQLAAIKIAKPEANRPAIDFRPNTAANKGTADDPAKAVLDGQLKVLEQQIAQEKTILTLRNALIDTYNKEGELSFQQYYESRKAASDQALTVEQTNIDKEIALLRKRIAVTGKDAEAAADQGKIDVLVERRKKLGIEAAISNIQAVEQQKLAYVAYGKEILTVEADLLTINEKFAQAAAIRFDSSHDVLAKRFSAEGNTEGTRALAILREYTVAQARYQEVSVAAARTQEQLSIAEGRIQLLQATGSISTIEALQREGAARQASIRIQEAEVVALEAIARASESPAAVVTAEKARLALERLKTTIDPLADKINQSLSTDFENAFAGFLQGTQTASQAFTAFANSVIANIAKIIAQQLAAKIFGGAAGGGGVGGLFSLLLGASGAATGGGVGAGDITRVAENGPETFAVQGKTYLLSGQAGTVSPAGSGSGGPVINISIASGVSRNELAAIIPQLTSSIKSQIRDEQHRPGGGY